MARVVEAAAPAYGEGLKWEKVVTKELAGASRLMQLSKVLGRPAPVPSIWMDGELVFDSTPSLEDLQASLDRRLAGTDG